MHKKRILRVVIVVAVVVIVLALLYVGGQYLIDWGVRMHGG
jgi:preprotein translocase subunit SecE